jgi:hypothetical protein
MVSGYFASLKIKPEEFWIFPRANYRHLCKLGICCESFLPVEPCENWKRSTKVWKYGDRAAIKSKLAAVLRNGGATLRVPMKAAANIWQTLGKTLNLKAFSVPEAVTVAPAY